MELYQLRTFVKIVEAGSLTRAAQELYTSQPAISAQLKALEDELGVTLFERTSRGMQPTPKGGLLYQQAVDTLAAAAKLKSDALQLREELVGDLRVGVHTDFEFMRVGELHRRLIAHHPQVRPHFTQSMSSLILPDIRRGALDAGFHFGPCRYADLASTQLDEVPMRVVGPAAWRETVVDASLADLADLPWVYTSETCPFFALMQELFDGVERQPRKVAYVDSEDAVRALIRAGSGISMLRADDAARLQTDGEAVCWPGETPSLRLGLAVARQRTGEPLIGALRRLVGELWQRDAPALDSIGA